MFIFIITIVASPVLATELEAVSLPKCDSALAKKCVADIYAYQEVCSGFTTITGFYSCVIAYASAQLDCYPCADKVFDFDAFMSCSTYNFHKCIDEIDESWKDCHKTFSNPFDGGLQCVFEESSAANLLLNKTVGIEGLSLWQLADNIDLTLL